MYQTIFFLPICDPENVSEGGGGHNYVCGGRGSVFLNAKSMRGSNEVEYGLVIVGNLTQYWVP